MSLVSARSRLSDITLGVFGAFPDPHSTHFGAGVRGESIFVYSVAPRIIWAGGGGRGDKR